jgi:hypothetical protein
LNNPGHQEPEVPEPEDLGPKELFAFFGLAAHWTQCLERAVIGLAVGLHIGDPKRTTRSMVDDLFERFEAQTLGRVLSAARALGALPSELDGSLKEALQTRNLLIHGFFWRHAEDFMTNAGRERMIRQLQSDMRALKAADRAAERASLTVWQRFGITREHLDKEFEALYRRVTQDRSPCLTQRAEELSSTAVAGMDEADEPGRDAPVAIAVPGHTLRYVPTLRRFTEGGR